MSTHIIGLYSNLTKIIFQLSNTHHISSSEELIRYESHQEKNCYLGFQLVQTQVNLLSYRR